jgi:hypothetical protein
MEIKKNPEVMEGEHQMQNLTSAMTFQTFTLMVLWKYVIAVASVIVVAAILQWWNVKLYDPPHTLAIHVSDLPSLLVFGLVTLTVVLLTNIGMKYSWNKIFRPNSGFTSKSRQSKKLIVCY